MSTIKQLTEEGYKVITNAYGAIIGVRKGNYIAYNSEEVNKVNDEEVNNTLVNRPLIQNPIQEEELIDLLDTSEHNEYFTNLLKMYKEKYNGYYRKPEFDKIYVYLNTDTSSYSLD